MRGEPQALLANMSAPPRTVVTLPRLRYANNEDRGPGTAEHPQPSIARLFAHVDLPTSVCAAAALPYDSPLLGAALGLPRVIVALARQASAARNGDTVPPLQEALQSLATLSDAALLEALVDVLLAQAWPQDTPSVGLASVCQSPVPPEGERHTVPTPAANTPDVLTTARLVSAIRGPLFLRDAAPALARLLSPWAPPNPLGSWKIWRPVAASGSTA